MRDNTSPHTRGSHRTGSKTGWVQVAPFAFAIFTTVACSGSVALNPEVAVNSISDQDLARDVSVLASDEYEGRRPGTRGEDLTVAYLEKRLQELGLAPGNPNGSFVQRVPLLGISATPRATVTTRGRRIALRTPDDFVARSLLNEEHTAVVESEVMFAGYGIEAQEYGWNDY